MLTINFLNTISKFMKQLMNTGCGIRKRFHIYCPGCGGTRALKEIVQFHFLKSLQYNPCILFMIIYVVFVVALEIRKKKMNPLLYCKLNIAAGMSVLMIIFSYSVIRDYLLIVKGIDLLGDFSGT